LKSKGLRFVDFVFFSRMVYVVRRTFWNFREIYKNHTDTGHALTTHKMDQCDGCHQTWCFTKCDVCEQHCCRRCCVKTLKYYCKSCYDCSTEKLQALNGWQDGWGNEEYFLDYILEEPNSTESVTNEGDQKDRENFVDAIFNMDEDIVAESIKIESDSETESEQEK